MHPQGHRGPGGFARLVEPADSRGAAAGAGTHVLGKVEGWNPAYAVKYRIDTSMVDAAE